MINSSKLDNHTIKVLEKSGWCKDRRIDISNWIEQLKSEGYKNSPYASEILEEFGGLNISPERIKTGKIYPGDIDFNALDAGSGEFDRMEIFEPIAGESLFPLGMVFGQWFLYVGLSNKIYMGSTVKLYILGESIEEFLNNIILGIQEPLELKKI